jgi:hypothetical protein
MSLFRRKPTLSEAVRRDLDETRRLLLMLIYVNTGEGMATQSRHSLGGTLVNSLCYHHLELGFEETSKNVDAMLYQAPPPPESVEWTHGCISSITAILAGVENGAVR